MTSDIPDRVLLEAFALAEEPARQRWQQWRTALDVERMDPRYLEILPLLAHRLHPWLDHDPARHTLQGLGRRVWARNQVRLRQLVEALTAIQDHAGTQAIVTGSAACALVLAGRKSVRPIEAPELLISREHAHAAAEALDHAGWNLRANQPRLEPALFDHREGVWFGNDSGDWLKLSWRLLPCAPDVARKREQRLPPQRCDVLGTSVSLLNTTDLMTQILAGYRDPRQLDWRWDALALKHEPLDWDRIAHDIDGDVEARLRICELKDIWHFAIPDRISTERRPSALAARVNRIWRDYRWITWSQGKSTSLPGFVAYLPQRWWKVFVTQRGAS